MSIQIDKGFHCTRWVIPAVVGRNEVDVDKVQGAEGLEKMRWPSKLVRSELDYLLEENPPYGCTPEPSQVSRFSTEWECTGHGARACDATTADFMINIAGEPRSPWNISAGHVFVNHFVQKMEYNDTQEMRKAIERAFTNWIRSFRASERSKHSWQQRKYQLFQRRRGVAKLFDPLKKHLDILDALGSNGMSSDESDVDCSSKRITYTVVKPDWCHPDLHNWLKVFDQLHH
ncbi:hypothetical protein BJY52DRAFT_1227877 [Lactarius psammicola]|nr:hypothetical protein BJY52DRAFT_1227877 [Lactarius psammicola]